MRFNMLWVLGLGLLFFALEASEKDLFIPRLTLRKISNNTNCVLRVQDNLRDTWFLLQPHTTIITELLLDTEGRPVTEYMHDETVTKRLTMLGYFFVRNDFNSLMGCTYNLFVQQTMGKENPVCVTNQFDRRTQVKGIAQFKEVGPTAVGLTIIDDDQGSFDVQLQLTPEPVPSPLLYERDDV